ncbi:hypothetical protein RhiirA4_472832 [Rhizophagus irregularis]|uniref:Uncharacterized protein n=1 Tax=Rhizophagus irregularis TaxID=588596 RepID=A0A2I1H5R8_9GLOM|nr:hypothetical protein RhiirA4_472832 [Rhizophagus irregularis]
MTSNTNNISDKSEAQLYEVLLYKKKDIIAIQKKLGMLPDRRKGPIENIYQTALNQSKKGKMLEDSFGLLFDLVGELIDVRGDLDVVGHPILTGSGTSLTFLPSFLGRTSWNVDFGLDFEIGRTLNILSTWFRLQNRKKDGPWILCRFQILYQPGLQNKKERWTLDIILAWTSNKKEVSSWWTSQNVDNGSDFEIVSRNI